MDGGKLRTARNCIGAMWVAAFSLLVSISFYLGKHRPTKPQVQYGMVYPIPYRSITVYVRWIEYLVAGPPMWCVAGGIGLALIVVGTLLSRSEQATSKIDRRLRHDPSELTWL